MTHSVGDPLPSHCTNLGSTPASSQAAKRFRPSKTWFLMRTMGLSSPRSLMSAASSRSSSWLMGGKRRHAGWNVSSSHDSARIEVRCHYTRGLDERGRGKDLIAGTVGSRVPKPFKKTPGVEKICFPTNYLIMVSN